jgi:hypothetical protein
MSFHSLLASLACAAVLASSSPARAQLVPTTGELLLAGADSASTRTRLPLVERLPGGGFIAVGSRWRGGLFARRFDAAGRALEAETLVPAAFGDRMMVKDVTALAGGGLAATWEHVRPTENTMTPYARAWRRDGSPVGEGFRVSEGTVGQQHPLGIVGLDGGGFAVLWTTTASRFVFARAFDAQGAPAGPEVDVTSEMRRHVSQVRMAALPGGGFVVVWAGQHRTIMRGRMNAFARLFDAAGMPVSGALRLSTLEGEHRVPAVARLGNEGFAVVFGVGRGDLVLRRFAPNGRPLGAEQPVAQHVPERIGHGPTFVTALADGGVAVAWTAWTPDPHTVLIRAFDAMGEPTGDAVPVVPEGGKNRSVFVSDIAGLAGGGVVVSWASGNSPFQPDFRIAGRLLTGATVKAEEPVAAPGALALAVAPNPIHDHASVSYALAAAGPVRLTLHDVLGRELAVLAAGARAAGAHAAALDASALPPGVYVLRLTAGAEVVTRRLTVRR